ncbi:MAG: Mov34/MPN/PAD-1 family protein [Pseudomonadota bacterium]|uniref:Peptidase n=1 Tax=Sphingobium xenophagum TaxID=121428 RepID=A0A249MP92_SPHXE|nr:MULTISPECIES: Mov34/MPN/PAD-1 family protein [Sphingobium]ASY43132.1 peptidase [Sphingobium xenophagum]MBG6117239.1 proteasome lid subunit RPN8/RPN11 [Sphingobium sp. JAI105]OUC55138.1 peptidase [Sphingobium sp. GW456-12-10-14-TSB1]PSO11226.1 peptidase [Sphingobium sp. AEW4]QWT13711.1 Mov34/MPN/PAD-1 family protein [Sphingobium xenophagum]|tara:strand:+ start:85 stop:486 length:402 start_codon:yes stop_codon:yes gene_type:complete
MAIAISRTLLDQIQSIAAADRAEVCGLLFGTAERIAAIAPAANVAPDPARHFELDPAALIAAHRAARAGGPPIIGHYHSHPSGVAVPSATDTACAAPDGSLWLIVAAGEARLWVAQGDGAGGVCFAPTTLQVV